LTLPAAAESPNLAVFVIFLLKAEIEVMLFAVTNSIPGALRPLDERSSSRVVGKYNQSEFRETMGKNLFGFALTH
jgi:hypothetical protein